jgi:PAS domain S-box-containing protein
MASAVAVAALLSTSLVALLYLALRRHLATRQSLFAAEQVARVAAEIHAAEQRRAEAALREQAEWTERLVRQQDTILETMAEGLYAVDPNGFVTYMNGAAERILGWRRDELLGRKMHEATHYAHPDGAPFPASDCAELRVLRSGTPLVNYEDVFIRKDGTFFPVVYSSTRLEGEDGVAGVVVVFRDVSRERAAAGEREALLATTERARQEAEAANRAKDLFLATVSHELRTPLSPIIAWAAMLEQGNLGPERARKAHATILRSARAQAQVIEDLLDISRIISGKMRLAVRPVDLRAVIETAVDVVRPGADAKGLRLQVVLDTETAPISGDADRLQQVVWNLLSNAIKFTPRGGRVTVVLERVNSDAEISVSDTGQGIAADFLPHVFDRFQQADASTTRQFAGLGLGLAIVRHIVEAHGGTIHAESPGVGHGAVFTVKLPLVLIPRTAGEVVRRHPTQAPLGAYDAPTLGGVRILVVDDEPDSNEVVRTLLADRGAEVRVAASAAQALELLGRWKPDLLVSDVGMPDEDGYSLLSKVRARDDDLAGLPAIALTAYASVDDRVRLLSAGFARHVPKPVEPMELIAVVAGLAGRRV